MAGNNNSGRKAKPDAIHRLNGNPSKKPLGQVNDLRSGAVDWSVVNTMPECPAFLDAVAQEKWYKLAPDLYELGLLTRVDTDALAAYCQNYSLWVKATEHIKIHGEVTLTPNGYPQMSVWVTLRKSAVSEMLSIQTSFGMNPAARSKQIQSAVTATQPSLFASEEEAREERLAYEFGLH
ncbi:phage terminase small subunit P27 family [Pelistega ratti]|uniref:phage terminase small subunit P27 family n=1 Tax=Pelistega ratti TaxID=2652177 RepID=UPI00135B0941|nr:phage terminase small subunit P27 family [Pelistega ratti]